MFALGFTCHSLIVSIIIHPARHVAAAGRVMGLRERQIDHQPTTQQQKGCAKPASTACDPAQPHLWEAAVEAGYPGALGTGCSITKSILKEDLITALRVGAPRQVGATLHIAPEEGFFIL